MINQSDIKYFIEVAKTQHVSRAAERLGVTQPALTYCLKRLEAETGSALFIRSKRGVTLTSAGEKLYLQSQALIEQWDRVMASVKEDALEVSGRIRLGCHSAVAQYTLPHLLPQLLKENPKLEFDIHHGLSRHMTEAVISSKLDVAFAVNPVAHPDLIIKEICRDDVGLWRAKGCENNDVLLTEPSLMQTQDILKKMKKKGIHFKRTVESSSLEVLAQLVSAGAGYAILPERVVKAIAHEKVERVRESPVFHDRTCLVYKREFTLNQRGKTFVKAALVLNS